MCQCNKGFEGPNCTDIDECGKFLFDCPNHASCQNIPGSFMCSCLPGYKGNETLCEDVDECAEGIAKCPSNETCENTIGNYTCICPAGSKRVNGYCQDIDECQNLVYCSKPGQRCVNTENSFKCECKNGFENSNETCKDINECLNEELNNCSKTQGLCANVEGSYSCQCKAGYSGDGITCSDVNECLDSNVCSKKNNTMCVNSEGSFNCTCSKGYEGLNCTDVNECLDSNACSWKNNSMCVNTEGSYICTCRSGYEGPNCTITVSTSSTSSASADRTPSPTSLPVPSTDGTTAAPTTETFTTEKHTSVSAVPTSDHASTSATKEISTVPSIPAVTTSTTVGPTTTGIPTTTSTTTTSTPGVTSTTKTMETSTTRATIPAVTTVSPTTTGISTTTSAATTATPKNISTTVPTTLTTTPIITTTFTTLTTSTTATTIVHTSTTTLPAITKPSTVQTTEPILVSNRLFEYGEKAHDKKLTATSPDVKSPVFKPEIGFPFGNTQYPLLYFTDNGLIVFPSSETEIFSYTNPPVNGFTASSKPPMIAVFWIDADLSGSVGNVFYQEYKTYGNESFNLTQRLETTIKRYLNFEYKAKWTLKITWDKVPAFPAAQTDVKTNTYQAVVSTDGSSSFVLMLYQAGGMNWDVSTLSSKNVVIGYNSGDGFLLNNVQMNLSATERFRPDKYKGPNTGLKGVRLHKLIQGTPRVNYKANCLSWFTLEPNPSKWNQSLLSCPCTFPQGQADNRFRNYNLGTSAKVLRSASPNAFGAGQRCTYTERNALIEGWQERYWTSTQSASSAQNKKSDLDPYTWCCENVDNPSFCEYYRNKRPSINCNNYRPPTRAMMVGDPHFTTLDGLRYTFNGLGDFVLLNVNESNGNTIFKLHGRTVQTGAALATNFMAFAAQHILTKSTTVQMILKNNDSIDVLLNNETKQFVPSTEDNKEIFRNGTFYMEKNGNASIIVSFGSGISLTVKAQYGMLLAITNLPADYLNKTEGLLGVWNGNPNDDFTMPNGSVIPANSKESTIFNYGKTWEVPWNSSIFTIGRTAPNNSFTPLYLDNLYQMNKTLYNILATECKNNTQCIFDAISTGRKEVGLSTAERNIEFQEVNKRLNSYPPIIQGPNVIYTQLFQQNISYYTATGKNVTFSPYITKDLNVTENGTLIWHPKSISGVSLEIEAIGSNNLSSVLRPQLVIHNCGKNGVCITSETTRINGSSVYKAACNCTAEFTGSDCQTKIDPCQTISCFPGVNCLSSGVCGTCPTGLTGEGIHCSDIDECKDNKLCSLNATCFNTVSGYNCTCNPGFSGNGKFCTAIDECGSSPCSPDATCSNITGSFSCTCNTGFTGTGTTCFPLPDSCSSYQGHFSFCSNGGTYVLNPANGCKPFCQCPSQFKGEKCTEAELVFFAQPLPTIPKRSVTITLKVQDVGVSVLNDRNSTAYKSLTHTTAEKVLGLLRNIEHFSENLEYVFWPSGKIVVITVVSYFNYNGNKTVIDFLNEELHDKILTAFNGKRLFTRALNADNITFERLNETDVQNKANLSYSELLDYFSCNNTEFAGYVLQWVDQIGVVCQSPCGINYCLNEAKCQHLRTGPLCECVPRTIYSSYGDRCEELSIELRAFFGILFGALALMLAIFFIVWKCKPRGRERLTNDTTSIADSNTTFSFKSHLFSPKMKDTHILPTLDDKDVSYDGWTPKLDSFNPNTKIKIQRPSLKENGTESA
ncbi:mucin-4-like [Cetorhinus maximus]